MFLIWGEGRGVSRGRAGAVAEVVCPPLWWCCVQGGLRRTLLWLPTPVFALQKQAVGFLVSLYLVVQNLPQLRMHAVIFSPL